MTAQYVVERLGDGQFRGTGLMFGGRRFWWGPMALFRVKSGRQGVWVIVGSGVVLDLTKAADVERCRLLADRADIVIENSRTGVAEKLGLGPQILRERNPRLIYCSVTGFGLTGSRRNQGGFDIVAQAMSGLMAMNGPKDGPPHRLPMPVADLTTAHMATIGVLAALAARDRTGQGQLVDVSLYESAASLGVFDAGLVLATGESPLRMGQASRNVAPYGVFAARAGWLVVGAGSQHLWERLCKILKLPALVEDLRFATNATRIANNDALIEILQKQFLNRSVDDWLTMLEVEGIPCGPVQDYTEVLNDPHLIERGLVVDSGSCRVLATPITLSGTPRSVRRRSPKLGEHTAENSPETTSGISPRQGSEAHHVQRAAFDHSVILFCMRWYFANGLSCGISRS